MSNLDIVGPKLLRIHCVFDDDSKTIQKKKCYEKITPVYLLSHGKDLYDEVCGTVLVSN